MYGRRRPGRRLGSANVDPGSLSKIVSAATTDAVYGLVGVDTTAASPMRLLTAGVGGQPVGRSDMATHTVMAVYPGHSRQFPRFAVSRPPRGSLGRASRRLAA
jgi:hypothetical protein